jgi:DNA-binding Lrp family transcriptional regulator
MTTGDPRAAPRLDRIDVRILDLLERNARISNAALAAAVHLSQSACRVRVKRLETAGIIRGYAAVLDADRLGLPVRVFAAVTLDSQSKAHASRFEARIDALAEAVECHVVSGATDYLVKFVCRDIARYNAITEMLLADETLGVKQIVSRFLLKTSKGDARRGIAGLSAGATAYPAG